MSIADRRQKVEVAVFDFDGTISDRDSLLPFLRYAVPKRRLALGIPALMPTLAGHGFGLISNSSAKETVLARYLKGMSEAEFRRLGELFAAGILPRLVRPAALERIEWHQRHGHRLVLISASLEAYLEPWGRTAGFDDVLATRLQASGGRLTGRFNGSNCHGAEKVARLRALLGDVEGVVGHAYGDSRGDRELLAVASHPHYRELNPS